MPELPGVRLARQKTRPHDEHLCLDNYFGGIKSVAYFYEEMARV